MKNIPYIIIGLIAAIWFAGCDVNEQFEGLDEMSKPTNVAYYLYTLTSSDYDAIGTSALAAAINSVDSAKAQIIKTKKYFSDTIPVGDYASSILDKKYKYGDEGSALMLTYDLYEQYDTATISPTNRYTLVTADYDTMGVSSGHPGQYDNFSSSIDPFYFLPIWLKMMNPYAKIDDIKLIRYLYYASGSTTQRKTVFVYDGSSWAPFVEVTPQEVKFKFKSGTWVYVNTDILVGLNTDTQISSNLGEFIPFSLVGDQVWSWDSWGYMKITGYLAGEYFDNEDWLVSPPMDLTERGDSVFLTFDHVARYFNDAAGTNTNMRKSISVWISTTSDGASIDPTDWVELVMPDPSYPTGTNWTFVSSGPLKLSEYSGLSNVRIAFKYLSSNADGFAGTWEVKNLYVYEKQD